MATYDHLRATLRAAQFLTTSHSMNFSRGKSGLIGDVLQIERHERAVREASPSPGDSETKLESDALAYPTVH